MIASTVAVSAALVGGLPVPVAANGHKPAAKKSTAPVGAGPSNGTMPSGVATPAAINQRGHVNNMCEAMQMMQLLVQQKGGMSTFGDYMLAYVVDAPKGWYETRDGSLAWRPPAPTETQHIEAVIMDSLTGQPLPMTGVTLDVLTPSGTVVQSQPLAFYWHPMGNHYGANYSIPTAGTYTIRVQAPAPDFRRHNIKLGNRLTDPVDASFTGVKLTPLTPAPSELAAPGTDTTVAPTENEMPPAAPTGSGPAMTTPATPANPSDLTQPYTTPPSPSQ